MAKQKRYDELRHDLESKMLQASTLPTRMERQGFVNQAFRAIYKAYQEKQVNHDEYVRLINRLGAYRHGEYNDYIDILAGSAQLGMLEMAIQGELSELSPEEARKRSQAVTHLTGVEPAQPDEEE